MSGIRGVTVERVRKLWLLGLLVLSLALPALAGGATTQVLVPGCGGSDKAAVKPKKIVIACGDGNLFVKKLKWSSWGSRSAHGKGTGRQNTCTPNCAQGRFKSYPMSISLTKPKACSNGKIEFRSLKYTYTGTRPSGLHKSYTVSRACSS